MLEGDALGVLRGIPGDGAVVAGRDDDRCKGVGRLTAGVVHRRRDEGPGDGVVWKG